MKRKNIAFYVSKKRGEKEKNDQNGIEPKTETSNSNVKRIVK